jgi:large subunit ribosomal protein L10
MTRAEKAQVISDLKEKFEKVNFFYLTDASTLSVADTNDLRRKFHENGVEMKVVKNTLARKALEQLEEAKGYDQLYDSLVGPTAVLFTENAATPAKLIKEFRKNHDKPEIKAAYIDSAVFIGDDKLKELAALKSKEELIGEIITLLQSPATNVIGALKSAGNTIAGIVKTLQEREN